MGKQEKAHVKYEPIIEGEGSGHVGQLVEIEKGRHMKSWVPGDERYKRCDPYQHMEQIDGI